MRSHRYLILVLALVLCFHSAAAAARYPLVRRQDGSSSQTSQAPSATGEQSSRPSSTAAPRESSIAKSESPSTTEGATSSSVIATASPTTQSPTTPTSNAPSTSSSAAADSKSPLPIHPKITPALGLAGMIMLISGAVYSVIGIKNKWLYVFVSAAYLTSLAVTVLIVYLMTPPVSNAVQGAFFIAAFITGAIFGALALVFADITDGLGCLLGGFCLSMWFLTLKEGGLIASTGGRAIFIGCMSVAGFTLSWTHYTRNYGLIGSISFSGATITMLGVDCFSRAGWKEFWLYLWNLNPDTFPLFTNTYPLTRGIKVELAGVVILTIFGIISQLRLWKLIKERRETNAAQRLERQRYQEQEEEELGRKIEDTFQREREQWEATYGDKSLQESGVDSSATTLKTSTSVQEKGSFRSDSVELTPLPKNGLAISATKQATVTVAVLREDDIQEIDAARNPMISKRRDPVDQASSLVSSVNSALPSSDGVAPGRMLRSMSARSSPQPSAPPPPVVVPLPFRVPQEEDTESESSDNTSVSAVPDTQEEPLPDRRSLSNRLSNMTGMKRLSAHRASVDRSDSEEALMISHIDEDRSSSIAATLDVDDVSVHELSQPRSPLDANYSAETTHPAVTKGPDSNARTETQPEREENQGVQNRSNPTGDDKAASVPKDTKTDILKTDITEAPSPSTGKPRQSLTVSTDPKLEEPRSKRAFSQSPRVRSDTVVSIVKEDCRSSQSKFGQSEGHSSGSRTEQAESIAGSFSGALPGRLSKVAQSYRVNEWAKHLEAAERPDLDDIPEPKSPGVKVEHERPAPVSEEIAQPLVVAKRNSNRVSSGSNVHRNSGFVRSSSNNSRISQTDLQPLSRTPSVLVVGEVYRSGSQSQERSARNSATQLLSPTEPANNGLSTPSPMASNTLMGQRETRVRNRVSTQSFNPLSASTNSLPIGSDQDMTLAQRKRALQHQKPPSASQKWQQSNWAGAQVQGFNSHQPKRTTGSGSTQKREELLAGWRESIRQEVTPLHTSTVTEEQRRAALVNAKRRTEMEKQQQSMVVQQRESMMHNMMRSNEMLDAHREAMRRMQAAANKNA